MGKSRDPYTPSPSLRLSLSYGSLVVAATWLIWTAFEIRNLHGLYRAHGVTNFRYPIAELTCGIALLILGAALARTKLWVVVPAIAVGVFLGAELYWIGATR